MRRWHDQSQRERMAGRGAPGRHAGGVVSGSAWAKGIAPDAVNRERDDFYPTPPEATRALLSVEQFCGGIWEPACGDGAISRVLEAAGYAVESSDLIDRGYGISNRDFLLEWQQMADNIVTNPPFKHAEDFARHSLRRARRRVAILCRLAWLEGKERGKMFATTPLARVWVFSSRVVMTRAGSEMPGGGGMIAFAWFVWDHEHSGPPTLGWLP